MKSKTMSIFVIAMLIAMISVISIITATENTTQTVNLIVTKVLSFEVTPPNYDYGDVMHGQCSVNGFIYLNNTGNVNITVETNATGVFSNINYNGTIGSGSWLDVDDFSVGIVAGYNQTVNTQICIPTGYAPGTYSDTVTFEYWEQ